MPRLSQEADIIAAAPQRTRPGRGGCLFCFRRFRRSSDAKYRTGGGKMKAVIIEDESDIMHGIRDVLGELGDTFERVDAFDNAEEAERHINEWRPEIVITDIVLPNASGLDLIERIARKGYQPKIVIVSGYNHFEYAQRGIKLGVHDYILKPFDKAQFRTVVAGVAEAAREERLAALRRDPEASALGAKALRDKFLHGLCLKKASLQEHVFHRLKFWSLEWLASAAYTVVAVAAAAPPGQRLPEKEADLTSFAIGNIVEELLQHFPPSVMFRNADNQWCLIVGLTDIEALTDEIVGKVAAYHKVPVRLGISEPGNGVQSLALAYDQATRALQVSRLSRGAAKQHYAALGLPGEAELSHAERLVQAIAAADAEAIAAHAGAALKELALREGASHIRELSRACLDWLTELHTRLSSQLASSLHHVPLELWDALDRCDSLESLRGCVVDYLQKLARDIAQTHSHYMIEKAKRLIERDFQTNVTLQGIAETLSIHPVWLSQLFKRECGVNFVDYLADIRIERAKRLLRESEMKVYEIVHAVGYQDLQHFGQIFKKKTGLSPKEFRFGK